MKEPVDIEELFEVYLNTFTSIRDECVQIMDYGKIEHPELSDFAMGMMHFFGDRCQAISALYQYNKPWDCEIVLRSALEAITKVLYVFSAEYELSLERISEFQSENYASESYSRSKKSSQVQKVSDDFRTQNICEGIILNTKDQDEYLSEWNRKKRKALSQKWSFSEMIKEIEASDTNGKYRNFTILSYCYDSSSHFIHADKTAINIIWDRNNNRKDNEAILLENSHYARIFNDLISLLFFSYHAMASKFNLLENAHVIHQKVLDFLEYSNKHFDVFYESQKDFYDSLKKETNS